jgi:hypothetical protein
MPIRPENRARYPKNGKTVVVPRIRERSGNRCECTGQCGRDHFDVTNERPLDRCGAWNGMPIDDIDGPCIVLTVAHLDHTPENCADENLLHMCQGCHNRYDAPMRAAGIKARKRALNASSDLFCEETK